MKDEGEKIFCALCATFGGVQALQPPPPSQSHTASSATEGKHLSWDTLIDVLKVIGLNTLACDIHDKICCTKLLFEQGIISVQLFNVFG